MEINLELYRIFYVVARYSNITKASNELHISQPAISKALKNLEDQLGGKLFTRTKRGVILTSEGEEFLTYIKSAMEYISNAENKFTDLINLETGTIKIGISATLTKNFLLPYLKKFHKLYPKIKIDINTNMSKDLITKLKNGLLDIVFLTTSDSDISSDLNTQKCEPIKDCFIAGKKYHNLLNKEISLNELSNYPLILESKGSNTRDFLDIYLQQNNLTLNPTMELSGYTLVTEFVKNDFGIGFVPENFINKDLQENELFKLKIKETIPKRYIEMVTSNNYLPSFSTKKLMEMIKEK